MFYRNVYIKKLFVCSQVQDAKITQLWRKKSWPDEHFSQVNIELTAKDGSTKLSLTQTGVPETDVEKTREGWRANYWDRMRQIFGWGSRLF